MAGKKAAGHSEPIRNPAGTQVQQRMAARILREIKKDAKGLSDSADRLLHRLS